MRIIAKRTLVNYFSKHTKSKSSLQSFIKEAEAAIWEKPNDIIQRYPSSDVITGKRFVFNISGNHFRLIVDIEFKLKIVFIVWIGTHSEYDRINVKEVKYVKNN